MNWRNSVISVASSTARILSAWKMGSTWTPIANTASKKFHVLFKKTRPPRHTAPDSHQSTSSEQGWLNMDEDIVTVFNDEPT
jgi:hypothetical protein